MVFINKKSPGKLYQGFFMRYSFTGGIGGDSGTEVDSIGFSFWLTTTLDPPCACKLGLVVVDLATAVQTVPMVTI